VVLAGGRGSRLGGMNKSLLEIEGVTILQRNLDILRPLFNEILLSGWPVGAELPDGVRSVKDNFRGKGPLAGIEASMKAAMTPYIFIFGGDMPWLSEEIIKSQALYFLEAPSEVLVPRTDNMAEPLHAIYNCGLHPSLEAYLNSDARPAVIDFIKLSKVRYFDLTPSEDTLRAFSNINTPEDLHDQSA